MRQTNIEAVVKIAESQLPAEVDQKSVSQDWINHYFSGVQDVSDSGLQALWGKILAGEVATPGRYSRRLIEFMKTIDSTVAKMVAAILSASFRDGTGWHFYFSDSRATSQAVSLGQQLTSVATVVTNRSVIEKINEELAPLMVSFRFATAGEGK